MTAVCKRCGAPVRSYSPMRKWCVECRRIISLEQARIRKMNHRLNGKNKLQLPKTSLKPVIRIKL
ncbi:MAG: hypothetical protein QXR48_02280 [Candidatus Woesearchaeota archaeon]